MFPIVPTTITKNYLESNIWTISDRADLKVIIKRCLNQTQLRVKTADLIGRLCLLSPSSLEPNKPPTGANKWSEEEGGGLIGRDSVER